MRSAGREARAAALVSAYPIPAMPRRIVTSDPDFLGGTPVFAGTRVPVQTLLDYLEGGESIDDFLEGFPSVKRQQVIAFLEEAKLRLTDDIVRDTIEKTRR